MVGVAIRYRSGQWLLLIAFTGGATLFDRSDTSDRTLLACPASNSQSVEQMVITATNDIHENSGRLPVTTTDDCA